MLKQSRNHQIYEVWSEWAAESAFVDHKPTKDEVDQLWNELWSNTTKRPEVIKLSPFFIRPKKQHWLERGED